MSVKTNEYALLAKDSYKDRTKDKDENKIITFGKTQYIILDTERDRLTGYQGTAYQKLGTDGQPVGEVIIAHRGTEFDREPIKDGLVDYGMVTVGLNAQATDAEMFTKRVMQKARAWADLKHQPIDITVTGHSLGGTLAEFTAHKFHLRGETFNAYGVAGLLHGVPEGGSQVINHVRATDVVSAASKHFGEVRIYATAQDIDRLSQAHYRDDGAGLRNVISAIDPGSHGIANFVPDAQGRSAFDLENTARYRAHQAMVDRYRHDVLTARTVLSARWEIQNDVQQFAYENGQAMAVAAAARWFATYEIARSATLKAIHVASETYDRAHDAAARSTQAMNDSAAYLAQSFSEVGNRLMAKSPSPAAAASLDEPSHPGHALFRQSLQGVQHLNSEHGVANSERDHRFAGALATAAAAAGLARIDRIVLSKDATQAYAINEEAMHDLWRRRPWSAQVETEAALNTPLTQSSAACAQAIMQRQSEEHAHTSTQDHVHQVSRGMSR